MDLANWALRNSPQGLNISSIRVFDQISSVIMYEGASVSAVRSLTLDDSPDISRPIHKHVFRILWKRWGDVQLLLCDFKHLLIDGPK